MLPDRVSNPGPLTYESGALPIALRGSANFYDFLFASLDYKAFQRWDLLQKKRNPSYRRKFFTFCIDPHWKRKEK